MAIRLNAPCMVEDVALLVEATGAYMIALTNLEVVGPHHISQVVDYGEGEGVLTLLKIGGKLNTEGRKHLGCNRLAVYSEGDRIHSSATELTAKSCVRDIDLLFKHKSSRELGKSAVLKRLCHNGSGRSNNGGHRIYSVGALVKLGALSGELNTEATRNVYGLNLAIIGQTVLHALKCPGLVDVLIGGIRLNDSGVKGDNILAAL